MAQAGSSGSPQRFWPRKWFKNREVDYQMTGRTDEAGQPCQSATEPAKMDGAEHRAPHPAAKDGPEKTTTMEE